VLIGTKGPLDAEILEAEMLEAELLEAEMLEAEPLGRRVASALAMDLTKANNRRNPKEILEAELLEAEMLEAEPLGRSTRADGEGSLTGCRVASALAMDLTKANNRRNPKEILEAEMLEAEPP
jgi:hypothetical protein